MFELTSTSVAIADTALIRSVSGESNATDVADRGSLVVAGCGTIFRTTIQRKCGPDPLSQAKLGAFPAQMT